MTNSVENNKTLKLKVDVSEQKFFKLHPSQEDIYYDQAVNRGHSSIHHRRIHSIKKKKKKTKKYKKKTTSHNTQQQQNQSWLHITPIRYKQTIQAVSNKKGRHGRLISKHLL